MTPKTESELVREVRRKLEEERRKEYRRQRIQTSFKAILSKYEATEAELMEILKEMLVSRVMKS